MENPDDHHHSATTSHPTCLKCGAATTPPPPPPTWSDTSPPPNYRPIRAPALNLPPNHSTQQAIILSPVPHPLPVPLAPPPHHFHTPSKRIHSHSDLLRFTSSPSAHSFLGFIAALSHSVQSLKISSPTAKPNPSSAAESITAVLHTLDSWVDEIPPVQQSARYGNASFRTWHERLVASTEPLMLRILSGVDDSRREAVVEIGPYFEDSFGNPSRIDYGTGHETNFAAWLYCLARIGVITEEDYPAVVLTAFVKYVEVMRRLQTVYCLEPAGSHGVWGLDDYCFLPFIFGSSQLVDHKYMKPKSIHNEDIVENFSGDYMYLSSVAFVKKMKKGLFAEHSPLLDDISGVPNWKKVNGGLLKMYRAEVLEKVPIMQHFLFGSLIKWEESD